MGVCSTVRIKGPRLSVEKAYLALRKLDREGPEG